MFILRFLVICASLSGLSGACWGCETQARADDTVVGAEKAANDAAAVDHGDDFYGENPQSFSLQYANDCFAQTRVVFYKPKQLLLTLSSGLSPPP